LVTGHRRESFGEGFESICRAIRRASEQFPEWDFLYPVHLNPNVQEPVKRILGGVQRVKLVDPLAYEPFVWLLDRSTIVLTDSGGVQEEAPSLGKPVLVMRETTERPEGVAAGNARLVGTAEESIYRNLVELIERPEARAAMASVRNPYGDGTAARQIVDFLAQ
jgi:UDP-N-acetylglucosamine 2-epimerase (non-hydrolysing)